MKTLLMTAIIMLLFVSPSLHSQPMVTESNFATIPIEEAKEMIKLCNTGQSSYDFVKSAFQCKRLDIISLCVETPAAWPWLFDAVNSLPDSPFKDQTVLMMIKSTSSIWPPEGLRYVGSRAFYFNM